MTPLSGSGVVRGNHLALIEVHELALGDVDRALADVDGPIGEADEVVDDGQQLQRPVDAPA